jgi:hypothetical protein
MKTMNLSKAHIITMNDPVTMNHFPRFLTIDIRTLSDKYTEKNYTLIKCIFMYTKY